MSLRVLLLGAGGFIGRELAAALAAGGHRVVACARRRPPQLPFGVHEVLIVDLNHATDAESWAPHLGGIDAVVNCAGILQGSRAQSIEAIHARSPIALFDACVRTGVRRVVQVSAISANPSAGTAYAATKHAADEYLRSTGLEWTVVRPSLVVARGAYGGTALMRGMASLPFAILVPGEGNESFQPIHVADLARVVVQAVETDRLARRTIDPVGPEVVSLRSLLEDYRRWLGFAPAPVVRVPLALVSAACQVGDVVGGPLNSTSRAQLAHGNTGDSRAFEEATGCGARGWRAILAAEPAHTQDRWHARLYFARPLLRMALALLWAGSGIAGLFATTEWAPRLAAATAISDLLASTLLAGACLVDLVIAALVLASWRPRVLAMAQLGVVAAYTAVATLLWPGMWSDPLGSLLKNVPILAAILAWGAIEEER